MVAVDDAIFEFGEVPLRLMARQPKLCKEGLRPRILVGAGGITKGMRGGVTEVTLVLGISDRIGTCNRGPML